MIGKRTCVANALRIIKRPPVFLSETGGLFIFHSAIVANGGKNANHLRDKLNILDYTLTAEETVKIATLDSGSFSLRRGIRLLKKDNRPELNPFF